MRAYSRWLGSTLREKLKRPFVHVIFGARQTGKSTLIRSILPADAAILNFSDPRERSRFSARPGLFLDLCKALPRNPEGTVVFVDEAQTVPEIFDAVQTLYDEDKDRFRFVLCGSSARRLRTTGANLLPGRSVRYILHPLVYEEYTPGDVPVSGGLERLVPLAPGDKPGTSSFPSRSLESRLVFGDLPGVALLRNDEDRKDILASYVLAYLEEEIRRESYLRDWGAFLRFLRLAAAESGGILNASALSREAGISAPTIKSHYGLLEDMFLGFSVQAFSGSPRKSALSTPRFYFFDNGVRNAAAGLPLSVELVNAEPGRLFEHWVAGQLFRKLSYRGDGSLSYFRTSDGAEIDFILHLNGRLVPIEAKWTENPGNKDARHLRRFLREHRDRCDRGYVVSRCPHVLELEESVTAIPWWLL